LHQRLGNAHPDEAPNRLGLGQDDRHPNSLGIRDTITQTFDAVVVDRPAQVADGALADPAPIHAGSIRAPLLFYFC
jgi:hypothetical protein